MSPEPLSPSSRIPRTASRGVRKSSSPSTPSDLSFTGDETHLLVDVGAVGGGGVTECVTQRLTLVFDGIS